MEATIIQSETYIATEVDEPAVAVQQRKVVTLIKPNFGGSPAWDPHEVWQRMIKQPRDRLKSSRKD